MIGDGEGKPEFPHSYSVGAAAKVGVCSPAGDAAPLVRVGVSFCTGGPISILIASRSISTWSAWAPRCFTLPYCKYASCGAGSGGAWLDDAVFAKSTGAAVCVVFGKVSLAAASTCGCEAFPTSVSNSCPRHSGFFWNTGFSAS